MSDSVDNPDIQTAQESNANMIKEENKKLKFKKPILVYLPCYNCENSVAQTIREIPSEFYGKIECLVVANNFDSSL